MVRHIFLGMALLSLFVFQSVGSAVQPTKTRVFLGVGIESTQDGAKHAGVVVRSVAPNSPATKAGDIIDKVDGKDVKDLESLLSVLGKRQPGEQASFHVLRDGQERDLAVTLGQRPEPRAGDGEAARERPAAFLGVQTLTLTPQVKENLGATIDKGAAIVDVLPDTPAAKAGLKRGDVITSFDGKTVSGPRELRDAVQGAGPGKEINLTIMRGQEKKDVQVRLEASPVDGLSNFLPLPGRLNSGAPNQLEERERSSQLERRVQELEKRVRELEQQRNPASK
jgi:serine protease Do